MSLQQLRLLLWCRFDPWSRELPYAVGMAKKKRKEEKKKKKKEAMSIPGGYLGISFEGNKK